MDFFLIFFYLISPVTLMVTRAISLWVATVKSAVPSGPEELPCLDLLIEVAPPGSGALMTSPLQCPPSFWVFSESFLSSLFSFLHPCRDASRRSLYHLLARRLSVLTRSYNYLREMRLSGDPNNCLLAFVIPFVVPFVCARLSMTFGSPSHLYIDSTSVS